MPPQFDGDETNPWRARRRAEYEATAAAWAAMGPLEHRLRRAICEVWRFDQADMPASELQRRIVVTAFFGAYGVAGHVVAIEGTPPRFLAVVVGTGPLAEVTVMTPPGLRRITATKPQRWQGLRRALLAWIREGSEESALGREIRRIAAAAWDGDQAEEEG